MFCYQTITKIGVPGSINKTIYYHHNSRLPTNERHSCEGCLFWRIPRIEIEAKLRQRGGRIHELHKLAAKLLIPS